MLGSRHLGDVVFIELIATSSSAYWSVTIFFKPLFFLKETPFDLYGLCSSGADAKHNGTDLSFLHDAQQTSVLVGGSWKASRDLTTHQHRASSAVSYEETIGASQPVPPCGLWSQKTTPVPWQDENTAYKNHSGAVCQNQLKEKPESHPIYNS